MSTSASAKSKVVTPGLHRRTGKIARLPHKVRDQLNHRLDDGHTGKSVIGWLNSLPEVQEIAKGSYGGRAVTEQNLSEWRQGGFRDWQRQQERHALARQWTEDGRDLEAISGTKGFSSTMSLILLAEMAQAARAVLEETTDAATRLACLQELARPVAQLRREESNAEKVRLATAQWDQEQAKANAWKESSSVFSPLKALLLQELYIDRFSQPGLSALEPRGAGGVSPNRDTASGDAEKSGVSE